MLLRPRTFTQAGLESLVERQATFSQIVFLLTVMEKD